MSNAVTQNSCNLCTPLGACLAFKGVESCITMLHGSQGCATYMRRFLISHFREPMDIASSSFTEETAIFGGEANLRRGLENIISQYDPDIIAVATTCLSETIGDDVALHLKQYERERDPEERPRLVLASTPSYRGNHSDGFYAAVLALIKTFVDLGSPKNNSLNLFPGMLSCEDLRHLKEIALDFGIPLNLVPDYSETLEGGVWSQYHVIAPGGAKMEELRRSAGATSSIAFKSVRRDEQSPAGFLAEQSGVPNLTIDTPIGLRASDLFFKSISDATKLPLPVKYKNERGRLLDAYSDSHKYLFGKRVALYGEADFIVPMASFILETGMTIAVCGTGEKNPGLLQALRRAAPEFDETGCSILCGVDFKEIESAAEGCGASLIIGNSRGYKMARRLGVPLIRVGFPIHDRIGGQRILHIGYRGALRLLDRITNEIIRTRQSSSRVGYAYM